MNESWNVVIEKSTGVIDVVPTCTVDCWKEKGWVTLGDSTSYFKASETADLLSTFN